MKKDILIFGDSIAYGVGDPLLGGWVDLLKRYVWSIKSNLNVYNFCIDGNSTRDLLHRLSIQSAQTLYKKEAVFIAIGINDSVFYQDGTVFMNEMEFSDNMKKLIAQAKSFSENIYIVGITAVDENITSPFADSRTGKTYANKRIQKFNAVLQEISASEGIKFISLFGLIDVDADMFDGLHVKTKGQKKMFDKILGEVHFLK